MTSPRTPRGTRSGDKARAYHRRWCQRGQRELPEGTQIIWRFALAPKFALYTEEREMKPW